MNHTVFTVRCMQRSHEWVLPNWIGLYLPPLAMPMEGKGSLKCVTLFSKEIFYRLEHERSFFFFFKFITNASSDETSTSRQMCHLQTIAHLTSLCTPQKYISPKLSLKIVNLTIYNTPLKKILCPGNGERNLTILSANICLYNLAIILYLTRSRLHLID